MNTLRYIMLAVLLMAMLPQKARAKTVVKPKGYLYGFVANFTDSVVYFTDIQEVDSIWYDTHSRFLLGRDQYAYQLRNYFNETLKMPHRTCIVSFGLTRKDAEKKLIKLRKLYTGKKAGRYEIRHLNENQFRFTTVSMSESIEAPMTKAERKAAREQLKQKQKEARLKQKENKLKQKQAEQERKQAEQERKQARKLEKAQRAKKEIPNRKPIDPNLPPAEVEMHE